MIDITRTLIQNDISTEISIKRMFKTVKHGKVDASLTRIMGVPNDLRSCFISKINLE